MFLSLPQLEAYNIKLSFITSSHLHEVNMNHGKYSIRIYKHSPHLINVTGIKKIDEVDQIKDELEEKFSIKIEKTRIDNLMASRRVKFIFDFEKIIQSMKKNDLDKVFYVSYDQETYAQRIFLKPREKPCPSIQLLYTGSVTVMGCKSFEDLNFCQRVIDLLYTSETLRRRNQPKETE